MFSRQPEEQKQSPSRAKDLLECEMGLCSVIQKFFVADFNSQGGNWRDFLNLLDEKLESFSRELLELRNQNHSAHLSDQSPQKNLNLKAQITDLSNSKSQLEEETQMQKSVLDKLENQIRILDIENKALRTQALDLHSQNKKLAQEKSRLEQERVTSDRNQELQNQISGFNSQFISLREENSSLKQSNQSLEKEIQALKSQNSDIAAKLVLEKELTRKLEAESKTLEKSETKIQELKAELKKQKENNLKLQEDNQKFSKAIQNSNSQNEGLKTQIRLLEEQLKGRTQKDQNTFEISRTEFEEIRAALTSKDIDLQQSVDKIQEYEKEISELCKQNMEYKAKIKEKDAVLGQAIDLIHESLEKLKPQSSTKMKEKKTTSEYLKREFDLLIEAFEVYIAESRREIEAETKRQLLERDEELNEIKKHIGDFEEIQRKQIDQKELLLKSLQQTLEKQAKDYASIESDKARLEIQIIELNKLIETQQKKIEEFRTGGETESQRVENLINENESLRKSINQMEIQLSATKKENVSLHQANTELRTQVGQLSNEKVELQSELEDRKQEYSQLSERLKWAAETSDQYISQLNQLQDVIASKDKELASFKENLQNLAKNDSDLQKMINNAHEEIKKLKDENQELLKSLKNREAEKDVLLEQVKTLEARQEETEDLLQQSVENEQAANRKTEALIHEKAKIEKEAERMVKEFQNQIDNIKKQSDESRTTFSEQLQNAKAKIEDYTNSIKKFENLLLEKDNQISENNSKRLTFEKKLEENESLIRKLNEEITHLESKNSELKHKINELESTQKALALEKENNTSTLTEKEKSWSQEHAKLQLALQSTQDERDKAVDQLKKQTKMNAELTSTNQALNEAIEMHTQNIRVLKSSLAVREQEIKTLREEVATLQRIKQEEEASLTKEHEAKVRELNHLLDLKQKTIEELKIGENERHQSLGSLATELENARKSLKQMEMQVMSSQKENQTIHKANDELRKRLDSENNEKELLKSELEEKKSEYNQLSERFKLAMAINEQNGMQITELKEEAKTKAEETDRLKDSIQKLIQSESNLQQEVNDSHNVINTQTSRIEKLELSISQFKMNEQNLQAEIERLKNDYQNQIEGLMREFQQHQSVLEKHIHELAQRETEISELKSMKQSLEKNLEESTALTQKSLEDLKGVNEKYIALKKEFETAKKERDLVLTKISTLTATLETSNQEITRLIQENTGLKEEARKNSSQNLSEVDTLKEHVARLENDLKEANFSKEKIEKTLNSKVDTLTAENSTLEQKLHLKETELAELKEDKEVVRRELKAKEEARASLQNEKEQLIKALKQQQEERKFDLEGLAKDKDSVIESLSRKLISLQQEFVDFQQQKDLEKSKNQSSIKQALVDKDQELLAVKKKLREMEEAAYTKFNQYETLLRDVEKELKDEKLHSDDLSKEILKHEKVKAAIFDELFDIIQEKGLLDFVPEEKLESPKEEALIDITRLVFSKLLEALEQQKDEKVKLEKELNLAKKRADELKEQTKPLEEARERALVSVKDEKVRAEKLEREKAELQNKLDEAKLNVEQRETVIKQKNTVIESQEKTILQLQEELRGWDDRLSKVLSPGSDKQDATATENDSGTVKKWILKIDTIIHGIISELDPTTAINDEMRIISAEDDVQTCERILFSKLKLIVENYKSSFDWKIKFEKY